MWIQSSKCDNAACLQVNMGFVKSSKCDSNHCLEVGVFSKSSKSGSSNCLEVGVFHKSSRSGSSNGACVEAALEPESELNVLVRDSKLLDEQTGQYHGDILSFNATSWQHFVRNLPSRP
jgi:Domain of unknown function (DUF397)